MSEKEFTEYTNKILKNIEKKINIEEKEFIFLLIESFNKKCMNVDKAIEFIKKYGTEAEQEINYILYKKEKHCICASDFNTGAKIVLDILQGNDNNEEKFGMYEPKFKETNFSEENSFEIAYETYYDNLEKEVL